MASQFQRDVEQSEIDEDEIRRRLDEELANMKYDPEQDDRFEQESNYSIFNQSQANFHQLEESQNIDDYLEELLRKQRLQGDLQIEQNQALLDFRALQQEQIKEVIPDEWTEQLNELKQLNQIQYSKNIIEDSHSVSLSQSDNFINNHQVERSAKFEIPQIKFAEEELIKEYELEEQKQKKQHQQQLIEQEFLEQQQKSISNSDKILTPQVQNNNVHKTNIKTQNKQNQFLNEYELELERFYMEREDRESRMRDEQQKGLESQMILSYLKYYDNLLKNIPVQKTPNPNVPMNDNFVKYKINLQLPSIIDFDNVKILYSKQKEEADEEQRRLDEIIFQKEQEHIRLTDLLNFSTQITTSIFDSQRTNNKSIMDQVNKLISNQTNISKVDTIVQNKQEIDIKINVGKSGNEIYKNEGDIFEKHFKSQFENQKNQIQQSLQALNKLLPTLKEFEPQSVTKSSNRDISNKWQIDQKEKESPIFQALELHAPEFNQLEKVEIKNEEWGNISASIFSNYKNLLTLNLSMNKISSIQNSFDCPNLIQLQLSDNLIKEITPQMFQKCDQLKYLNLDLNQIKKIQNLQQLTNLEELFIVNNQIQQIEGLNTLIKLRKLNLSFNKIQKIENLQSLAILEYLDLGKNQIVNIEHLSNSTNKFFFLTELQLYSNEIKIIPKNLSFPQLRILNINRNQDLEKLCIQMCPLLEILTCSYCQIRDLGQLSSCMVLKELDISFNQISSLEQFLEIIKYNRYLKQIRYNDNPFSLNKDQQFDRHLLVNYNLLERINGELIKNKASNDFIIKFTPSYINQLNQVALLRQYIIKLMSSKIRISYFSTTYMMKYLRQILPYIVLQDISQQNMQTSNKSVIFKICDQLLLNHQYVNAQRNSVSVILRYWKKRKFRQQALLKKMQFHIPQIIKIQSLMKGFHIRLKYQQKVQQIKRDAPKRTTKYKKISKLQAYIKGYLFRLRRQKALKNLQSKKPQDDFSEDDIDIDNFLNVKQDNFDNGLILPNEDIMQQMINIMANSKLPSQNNVLTQFLPNSSNEINNQIKLPIIKNSSSNMTDKILPKSMMPQNNQMLNSNNNYFYGNRNNTMSEIDMNNGSNSNKIGGIKKNTLMQSNGMEFNAAMKQTPKRLPSLSGDSETERQSAYSVNSNPFYPRANQRLEEEKKQQKREEVKKEWGFQNEETMKIWEARQKKKTGMKAKKQLTAAERYQLLLEKKNH